MHKTGRVAVLLACLGFVACERDGPVAPTGSAFQAVVGDVLAVESVTGSGHVMLGGDFRNFSFSAVRLADGSVRGEFQLKSRSSGAVIHGNVTCFTILGNQAWLGGETERSTVTTGVAQWRVKDLGEGGDAADQFSLVVVGGAAGTAEAYCARTPAFPVLLTGELGNIQIQPLDTSPFSGLWVGQRFNADGALCCRYEWALEQTGDVVSGLLFAPHSGCAITGCPVDATVSGNTMSFVTHLTFAGPDTFERGTAVVDGETMTGSFEQCFFGFCTGGLTFSLTRR